MARVELPAMPERIQKNFSERSNDGFPIGVRNGGISNSTKELDQAICCLDAATGRQANPSRRTERTWMPSSQQGDFMASRTISIRASRSKGPEK
jgi:hypothetical protein